MILLTVLDKGTLLQGTEINREMRKYGLAFKPLKRSFRSKGHTSVCWLSPRRRPVTCDSAQEWLKRGAEPLQAVPLQCFRYHTASIKFTPKSGKRGWFSDQLVQINQSFIKMRAEKTADLARAGTFGLLDESSGGSWSSAALISHFLFLSISLLFSLYARRIRSMCVSHTHIL